MANTLYPTFTLTSVDDTTGESDTYSPNLAAITQSAAGEAGDTVTVATSDTLISLGSLTAPGYGWIRNHDATNYIEYGPGDGSSADLLVIWGKLLPGEVHPVRLAAGVTLHAKAHTAPCKLKFRFFET